MSQSLNIMNQCRSFYSCCGSSLTYYADSRMQRRKLCLWSLTKLQLCQCGGTKKNHCWYPAVILTVRYELNETLASIADIYQTIGGGPPCLNGNRWFKDRFASQSAIWPWILLIGEEGVARSHDRDWSSHPTLSCLLLSNHSYQKWFRWLFAPVTVILV